MYEKSCQCSWKARLEFVAEDFEQAAKWGTTEDNFEWTNSLAYLSTQQPFVEHVPQASLC